MQIKKGIVLRWQRSRKLIFKHICFLKVIYTTSPKKTRHKLLDASSHKEKSKLFWNSESCSTSRKVYFDAWMRMKAPSCRDRKQIWKMKPFLRLQFNGNARALPATIKIFLLNKNSTTNQTTTTKSPRFRNFILRRAQDFDEHKRVKFAQASGKLAAFSDH